MKIYLAGKIPKGKELDDYVNWRKDYEKVLLKKFPNCKFLDPDLTEVGNITTEKDSLFWFGHDSWMISECDIVIVQADRKLGAGTSQEMLIAKYFSKPVIVVLPKNSHHRRNNIMMRSGFVEEWIHPFINSTSDLIVENLEESLNWLSEYEKNLKKKEIKDISVIDKAIVYFRKKAGL